MKPRSLRLCLAACIALLAASAGAQPRPAGPPQQPPEQGSPPPPAQPAPGLLPRETLPTVALSDVLERVARNSNKQFLVDFRTPQQIFLAGAKLEDVNYPLLLSILRNNGLAAATIDGRVNIMPDANIRAYPVPVVNRDDAKIPDEEVVQRVITTSNIEAPQIVPILRPLMPQAAHLAAVPPNKLVVVDRYANVKRISELVKELDR
jgi:general secretion pathway protein D